MSEDRSSPAPSTGGGRTSGGRLPPPAFPRSRGVAGEPAPTPRAPEDDEGEPLIPEEAFIPPDAPIVRKEPPRKPEDFERVMKGGHEVSPAAPGQGAPPAGGRVEAEAASGDAGAGDEAPRADVRPDRGGSSDPAVADLASRVGDLADGLRERGEVALRTTPEMSRFEATLRAYCVGYLAGLRRED